MKKHLEDDFDWEDFEQNESSNKNFMIFISKIVRCWYWFVLFAIIGLFAGILYSKTTHPQYNVKAKLLVSDGDKGSAEDAILGNLVNLMGSKSSPDNEVEILSTADLMQEVVLEDKLYINYSLIQTFKDEVVYDLPLALICQTSPMNIKKGASFKVHALAGNQSFEFSTPDTVFKVSLGKPFHLADMGTFQLERVHQGALPANDIRIAISPVMTAVQSCSGRFSAQVTGKQVSTISLNWITEVPAQGTILLNTLIKKYLQRNLNDKNVVADSTLSFINARLTSVKSELAGVEDQIAGYKRTHQMADISAQGQLLLEGSADFSKSLAEVETQLASLDIVEGYLKDAKHPHVVPSVNFSDNTAFSILLGSYNELILQKERLLLSNTEENPLVENVSQQIAKLRQDMLVNLRSTRQQLQLTKRSQQQMSSQISSQITNVPTLERGFIDMARLKQIKQEQYIFLQEKWEETAISRTANVANTKVIDSPKADIVPFAPNKKMMYLGGLLIGLFIPLISLFIKEKLNLRIQHISDVQEKTDLPVLGFVRHSTEGKDVVVTENSRSLISEQFRVIRTNLTFCLKSGKTILVTSSMSGEGKSFITLNLAMSFALLNKKVLVLELDLRKPTIASKLGVSYKNGFSNYIINPQLHSSDLIVNSGIHRMFDVLPSGPIPPNPAELIMDERTTQLMNEVKGHYDFIIIDSSPIGMVSDAQLLGQYADLTLYIMREGVTFKEQINIPNELVSSHKLKPLQLIYNDVNVKNKHYGEYTYGYGYGYGLEETDKNWFHRIKAFFNKK